MNAENVEIAVEVKKETEKALLIFDGKIETWIPKSLINECHKEKDIITSVVIPEWFALDKELI